MKDIFLDNYMTPKEVRRMKEPKRADNVKIVNHPIHGKVYVCPFPPSHFSDLQAEAKRIRFNDDTRTNKLP